MSENKTVTGTVRRSEVFQGSKSEHTAFVLESDSGKFILRKTGENPFTGNFFAAWLGKKVTVSGSLEGKTLFVETIRET